MTREAAILRLLGDTVVPAPTLVAVDATATYCDHPSLLMSRLPGPYAWTIRVPTVAPSRWPGNWRVSIGCR